MEKLVKIKKNNWDSSIICDTVKDAVCLLRGEFPRVLNINCTAVLHSF